MSIKILEQSNYTIRAMALNPKVVPGNALMELETTTAYFAYTDDSSGAKRCLKNITAKNVKHLKSYFCFGQCYILYFLLVMQDSPLSA